MLLALFKPHDIFISYVVEDREIVEDLVARLEAQDLKVWYAKKEFFPGADIPVLIRQGIESSRYGVAIISSSYRTYWSSGELFNLMARRNRFIPVLHELDIDMLSNDPPIINWYTVSTGSGLEQVASSIGKKVKRKSSLYYGLAKFALYLKQHPFTARVTTVLLLLSLLIYFAFQYFVPSSPDHRIIADAIRGRIEYIESRAHDEFQQNLSKDAKQSEIGEITNSISEISGYRNSTHERNTFYFHNGVEEMKSLAAIKNSGIISSMNQDDPEFGLRENIGFLSRKNFASVRFGFVNKLPVVYEIVEKRNAKAGLFEVEVKYTNPLRYTTTQLVWDTLNNTRYRNVTLFGLKPSEVLIFEKTGERWSWTAIQ